MAAKSCVDLGSKENLFKKDSVNTPVLASQSCSLFDKTVAITAKAVDVITEHKHTYCTARILSDIRPIFSRKAESAEAAVIVHNLQIGYHDGGSGEHKEFYVTLDTDDIIALKDGLKRADKKTLVLESILKHSSVQYLKVE